jgi:DNA-binding NarL/FixJ family response regulator
MAISLVFADPHPLFLLGLESLFASDAGFRILARCGTAGETLEATRRFQPDLLILDLDFPDGNGLQVLRQLKGDALPTRTVLLTAALGDEQAMEAFRIGVHGVVLKSMPAHLLVQCLQRVHAGGQWLEKHSVGRAIEKMLRREAGTRRVASILTAREIEITRLLAEGLSNREIGGKLAIQEGTVKIHLHHIYRKLGVGSRVDLTLYAQKKGLV